MEEPALPPVPKEFANASRLRLNDVALAPPELSRLPRKADQISMQSAKKGKLPLSLAHQKAVAEAREKAIHTYRELKESRAKGT